MDEYRLHLLECLIECGLDKEDAAIYFELSRRPLCRAAELAHALKTSRMNVYRKMKELQDKGLVTAALGKPIRFEAIPIRDVLDKIGKGLKDRLATIESNRNSLTEAFGQLTPSDITIPKFQIHQGRSKVYDQILSMCKSARKEIRIVTTGREIARLALVGLDDILKEVSQSLGRSSVKILTGVEEFNVRSLEEAMEYAELRHNAKQSVQRLVIVDKQSALSSMILADSIGSGSEDDVALWTDAQSYATSMAGFFDQVWEDSIDCRKVIEALRAGVPLQHIRIVSGLEAYTEIATQMITQAKSTVLITCGSITSGLLDKQPLREMSAKGVKVRILMSITKETHKDVVEMLGFATVRHLDTPLGVDFLVADGQEILQRLAMGSQTDGPSFTQAVWSNITSYVHYSTQIVEHSWNKAIEAANILSKLEAEKTLQDGLEELSKLLEHHGFPTEMPGVVMGDSGTLHHFDLVARSPTSKDPVVVANMMQEPATSRIVEMYAKSIDLHSKHRYLFTRVQPRNNQLSLANLYDIRIVTAADRIQTLLEHMFSDQE